MLEPNWQDELLRVVRNGEFLPDMVGFHGTRRQPNQDGGSRFDRLDNLVRPCGATQNSPAIDPHGIAGTVEGCHQPLNEIPIIT